MLAGHAKVIGSTPIRGMIFKFFIIGLYILSVQIWPFLPPYGDQIYVYLSDDARVYGISGLPTGIRAPRANIADDATNIKTQFWARIYFIFLINKFLA